MSLDILLILKLGLAELDGMRDRGGLKSGWDRCQEFPLRVQWVWSWYEILAGPAGIERE